tara:strand:+ start:343 stop:546 length:204 start_codon:yes stop_codon:yes gene_type:complete
MVMRRKLLRKKMRRKRRRRITTKITMKMKNLIHFAKLMVLVKRRKVLMERDLNLIVDRYTKSIINLT